MAQGLQLLFTSGSTRNGSLNVRLAHAAKRVAEAEGHAATYLDLSEYPLPIYDADLEARDGIPENAGKLKHVLDAHQGVFIASPEYNAGMAPLLKNTIDWVSRISEGGKPSGTVFKTRAFAIAAASPSETGGIRGLIQLRQTLATGLGAIVLGGQVLVPGGAAAFTAEGDLAEARRQEFLVAAVRTLATTARKLYLEDT